MPDPCLINNQKFELGRRFSLKLRFKVIGSNGG